ncbi:MAG TPA: ATP-dependent helicase, partial [Devosia sp.]|nr:ATP-dependent helicase [Devosia sp.]
IELTRRNIPFVKFGGLKFLDSVHVKDMLALLRFAENPRDRVAGFRILTMLPGIGPASAGRLLDQIAEAPRPLAALAEAASPARAGEAWPGLAELMAELGSRRAGWPAEFDRARTWYEPIAEPRHDDWLLRQQDLLQLQQIASGFPSRERFLTELTLDPPDATSEAVPPLKDEDYLILSTIHSAKGQEWRSVHVLNVADGGIPSDLGMGTPEEIEEERRLLYVAMTRARDHLHLIVPQRFYVRQQRPDGDRHLYAQRSRFIDKAMLPLFDDIFWPPLPKLATTAPQPGAARLDLGATMRSMWAK